MAALRLPPVGWWLPPLAAFVAAQLVRFLIVEPPAFQHACDPAPWTGWCLGRSLLIQTFATQGLGWLSLAAGIVALCAARGSRLGLRAAQVALASGAAGLVLYCFEPATVGVLLAAVSLARPRQVIAQAISDTSAR